MGAYLILYPRVRVFAMVPLGLLLTSVALPAWTMLLYWMGIQVVSGLWRAGLKPSGGVAFWAHVGGVHHGYGLDQAVHAVGLCSRPPGSALAAQRCSAGG